MSRLIQQSNAEMAKRVRFTATFNWWLDVSTGENGVDFNRLPVSIRYIVDDIGIDELQKLKNVSVSSGPFGMVEVNGYLIDVQDWELFLKEDLS